MNIVEKSLELNENRYKLRPPIITTVIAHSIQLLALLNSMYGTYYQTLHLQLERGRFSFCCVRNSDPNLDTLHLQPIETRGQRTKSYRTQPNIQHAPQASVAEADQPGTQNEQRELSQPAPPGSFQMNPKLFKRISP
jgi:hypothetical protein